MLAQGLNFVSLYQESCYHSSIGKLVDGPVMGRSPSQSMIQSAVI